MATVPPSQRRKRPTGERTAGRQPLAGPKSGTRTASRKTASRGRHLKLIRGGGARVQKAVPQVARKKHRSAVVRARASRARPVGLAQRFNALSSRRGIALAAVASLILSLFVFGLLTLHILLAQSSFQLEAVREKVVLEEERNRGMRFEIAGATSPASVAEAASRLGLVVPRQHHNLFAPSDETDDASNEGAPKERDNLKAVLSKRP